MKNKNRHTIIQFTARLGLVFLYFSFLVVQLLSFNFDTCNNNNINTQVISLYHPSASLETSKAIHTEKSTTEKNPKINIRLNKRFEPQKVICCNLVFLKKPGYELLDNNKRGYITNNKTTPSFASCLMRGPPEVA